MYLKLSYTYGATGMKKRKT